MHCLAGVEGDRWRLCPLSARVLVGSVHSVSELFGEGAFGEQFGEPSGSMITYAD